MPRITMICLLVTTLVLNVGYSAQAPSGGCSTQASRVIAQKLADQWDQAQANQDLNQVLSFVDSSFVSTDARGKRAGFAEIRRQTEQGFAVSRSVNPSTTVEDVQLEAGRMVVYWKTESHYEFHDQRNGWQPQIFKATGETTWERKGTEWKMVRSTTFRADTQVDPKWVEEQKTIAINHYKAAQRVAESAGCPCR